MYSACLLFAQQAFQACLLRTKYVVLLTGFLHLQNTDIQPNARPADIGLQEPALPTPFSSLLLTSGTGHLSHFREHLERQGCGIWVRHSRRAGPSLGYLIVRRRISESSLPRQCWVETLHHTKGQGDPGAVLGTGHTLVWSFVPDLYVVLRCLLPAVASFILDLGLGCRLSLTLGTATPQKNWAKDK